MQKKENFDFKHKNPTEIKTSGTKEHGNADYPVNSAVTEEETHEDTNKAAHIEKPLIKPKAEPRNKRVQLLLTESNHLKIKEYAANSGTSVNDAINQIIENI